MNMKEVHKKVTQIMSLEQSLLCINCPDFTVCPACDPIHREIDLIACIDDSEYFIEATEYILTHLKNERKKLMLLENGDAIREGVNILKDLLEEWLPEPY